MAAREYGQYCGITRALELVGERWALLIIRDLLVGPRRYGELAAGLPRIPSNILGTWGFKAMGDPREEQIITADSMTMALRTAFRPEIAAGLPATAYAAQFGPAELLVRVRGSTLEVAPGDGPADLAFAAGAGIRRLISGELAPTAPSRPALSRCCAGGVSCSTASHRPSTHLAA